MRIWQTLVLVLLSSPLASPQTLKITGGTVPYQVLQRSFQANTAAIPLNGTATGVPDGRAIQVRLTSHDQPVSNFGRIYDWSSAGTVKNGVWKVSLADVPAGGPYRIDVRLVGSTEVAVVENVLIGDLWLLAGQSNMEGLGDLENVQAPDPLVNLFDQSDVWRNATEPLHSLPDAVDPVHWRGTPPVRLMGAARDQYLKARRKGAGLGLPFAVNLLQSTRVPVGLIPCAHGGTSMDQWSPSLVSEGGRSLYGATLRRVKAAGGKVAGVLWYQGESDTKPQIASQFQAKFESFVTALRRDLGDPALPFLYFQIGRTINADDQKEWNMVQEAQRLAEPRIPHSWMIPTITSNLDDRIHVSTPDLKRLGRQAALLAATARAGGNGDVGATVGGYAPIVVQTGTLRRGPRPLYARREGQTIKVGFEQANGSLVAPGRLTGFSIRDASGHELAAIYKALIDSSDPTTVLLYLTGEVPQDAAIWYGAGKDPDCNLSDSQGFAVPVFGPFPVTAVNTQAPSAP